MLQAKYFDKIYENKVLHPNIKPSLSLWMY